MKKGIKRLAHLLLAMAVIATQVFIFLPATQAADTGNLALGKTITASNHTQTYAAANANDGNVNTYWEGAPNSYPNTLTVDLGSPQPVYKVVLKLNASWGARTQTLSVLTSTDNNAYTTSAPSNTYTFNPSGGNTVTITFSETNARYVRLNFTANSGATGGQAAEFEVYGTAPPAGGTPDLVVTDISWSPANPAAGNAVTFSATIRNQGTGAKSAGIINGVSFMVDGTQVNWSDNNTDAIAAGDSLTVTANGGPTGAATWTAVSGSHNITAWVDDVNRIAESDENNNQLSKVLVPDGGTPNQPDLIISDIIYSPAAPSAGNQVSFSAVVRNQGTAAGSAGTVTFQVDGVQVAASGNSTAPVSAGAASTISGNGTWTATSGTHTLSAAVDTGNITEESNENNNTYSESLTVGGGGGGTPDLVVTDITSSPASPLTGNAVVFSAVVKNQGTGATPAGTIIGVGFLVDNTQVSWSDNTTSSLAAGASVTVTANGGPNGSASWTATTGNHNVTAWVDDVNRISESNESNNQYSENLSVTPTPMPDLIVTDVTYAPASPVAGDPVNFTAVVRNQGTAPGAAGIVAFKIDGAQVAASANNTGSIAPGATLVINGTAPWTATAGSHSLSATADSSNTTAEGNETNNTYVTNMTVSPKPGIDLVITNITWTPSSPSAGNSISFSAVVNNQGTVAGTAGIVTFRVDGTQVAASLNSTVPIPAASSITVNASGAWTAAGGTHTVTATADSGNTTAETDETNNSYSVNMTVISGDRGATMPYIRYESEEGTRGGSAILRSAPTFDYSLTASEATNQQYVALPSNGASVEWTIHQNNAAGVNMRFTMPDSSDGMGLNGSLDVYVNNNKVKTVQLSSYWSWQYFNGDQPQDAPSGGQAAFRFDEVHFLLDTPLNSGDRLRIQKTNGDNIEYGVDFVEIETVPSPIAKPANYLSVTDFGATPDDSTDDMAAFNACVNAASAAGMNVYIPAGRFNLTGIWRIGAANIKILGAGIWYTNIHFPSSQPSGGGISGSDSCTNFEFSNVYLSSMLRSRWNQNAIYKCFMDTYGTNSYIHDFWEEHFECGFWIGDYDDTILATDRLTIANGRIRNNLADGVNFCQGTKNSIVQNCSVRNNGDDGLAVWPDSTMGAPMGVNNTFAYNTIENNWRAAAIAIFGGSGHSAHHNYIKDTFMGSGIRLNTVFPGYHFDNNTGITFSDTTIINCGTSKDCYNGERGAIDLEASGTGIRNITFENIDIINAQRDAIQIGYGGGFSGINFNNITIDGTGKDAITSSRFSSPHLGTAIFTYTGNGSATFRNLVTRNIEAADPYLIMNGFNITFQ